MTDKELKKRLKKLGVILVLIVLLIIFLSFYTLSSAKAKLSICSNTDYENSSQALGIEEEELKQYLAIFSILVNQDLKETNLQVLEMSTYFIDNMCSSYEVEMNAEGRKCYDVEIIEQVAKELNGNYSKESIADGEYYTYNKEENVYVQNKILEQMPYCTKIENISKNGDKIEVTYQLARLTSEQMSEYMTDKDVDMEIQTIKAVVLKNVDYEYSKYFISSIEEI